MRGRYLFRIFSFGFVAASAVFAEEVVEASVDAPQATLSTDASEVAPPEPIELRAAPPSAAILAEEGAPAYAGARAERRPSSVEDFESLPYLERYVPEPQQWEVGLFTGLLFPASDHNLKVASLPAEEYNTVSGVLGARLAYYPLSFVGVEAEGMVSPSATRDTNRSAILYAARGQAILQLPLVSIVPFAVVGGGVLGGISQPMGHDGDPAFHFGVGAKIPIQKVIGVRLDLRDTLIQKGGAASQGTATHNFEVLLGATFTFDRHGPSHARPDADYDGLYDDEDECPTVGALTANGCPVDSDGDGFPDGEDDCPRAAGAEGEMCPNPDPDGDGVPAPCDLCPDQPGNPPDGCGARDTDGDGFDDAVDKCPTEAELRNGFEDEDGCPDTVPEAMKRFTGVMRGISFDKGKSTIRKESLATLDAAAQVLAEYPSIRLEISGHTSSEGADDVNQKLSLDRANSVVDYLKSKGIEDSRLTARGAGSSEPIADNGTAAGREENRRIEFRIVAQP